MKNILTLSALIGLLGGYIITSLPALADNADKAARDAAKAAAEQNTANKDVAKGRPIRAGRAARKAERDQEKAAREAAKAAQGK